MITATKTHKVATETQKDTPYAEESGLITLTLKALKVSPTT